MVQQHTKAPCGLVSEQAVGIACYVSKSVKLLDVSVFHLAGLQMAVLENDWSESASYMFVKVRSTKLFFLYVYTA